MAIRFEWYENPTNTEEEKTLYHARPILNGSADTKEIATQIQELCALTEVDVNAVLNALSYVTSTHLKEGKRVHLNGLGYFQLSLSCDEEIEADTKYRNTKVKVKTVRFRADQELKDRIGETKLVHSAHGTHSKKLSDEHIIKRLHTHFSKQPILTRKEFQQLCGMTRTTASRRIQKLREAGVLKNIGTQAQPIYMLGEV